MMEQSQSSNSERGSILHFVIENHSGVGFLEKSKHILVFIKKNALRNFLKNPLHGIREVF